MTVIEFARKGGKARAASLTKERRIAIARKAGQASAIIRKLASKSVNHAKSESNEEIPENKL